MSILALRTALVLAAALTVVSPLSAQTASRTPQPAPMAKRPPATVAELYAGARQAALKQDSKTALRQLNQAVAKGFIAAETLEQEADFISLRKLPGWVRLVGFASARQRQHESAFDPKLMALMREMRYQDQHYRHIAAEAERQYGPGSPQEQAAERAQSPLDLQLIRQVDSLITIHGYPGKSKVGEYQKSTAFLVIQHNPDEKYLPLLTAAADKGELNWSSVALLIDRTRGMKGEKQLYGSQLGPAVNGKYTLQPIEDEPNVNVRRARVGLEPLEEYLKQNYDVAYQVPTATHNPNPPELYTQPRSATEEEEESPVELIGGNEALYARLQYPAAARQQNLSGSVTLQMTIDPQGAPQNVMVVRGLGAGCDEEALRVMRAARFTNARGQDHEIRMSLPFPYVAGK
ncbi:energy transducer TonB [Hymenobacter sp. NST-14]|uniref:energy transducer TonB n=1 Tax=Hymenobacter piscis TaxID=2839984 RepID=UPI001C0184F7|nr:energy transducer TonB [Hymenobacter piscis]MBT9394256.1 energy transducer TonB [Hymenobacter piscis]